MSTNPPKRINFHFVTGNPQTDTEKRTVRTIVRSNASNRRWRLVRETAAKSKAVEDSLTDASVTPELTNETESHNSNSEPDHQNKIVKRQRLVHRNVRRLSRTKSQDESPPETSPLKVVNIAQNYLGAMPATDISMQSINRLLQGTAISYAQLFPSGRSSLVSHVAKDWFQECLHNRGVLHTALFCQARRATAVRPGSIPMSRNELILCQTEAVHAITDKLLQQSTATDDESLRIVFSLTWHGPVKQEAPRQTPRQVPLADLQSLRLFLGIIASDPVHARGLDRMISLRGGLHTVETPGLAFLISYGDILGASSDLRRPIWAYASYAQHNPDALVDEDWWTAIRRPDHSLSSLGNGFTALHVWLPCEKATQLQLVMNGMADYTRASDDFIRQAPMDRNNALMSDQRNMIQHQLMSLCPQPCDELESQDLFEVVWLAAVAYSMIAVFPLAPNAARFDRLAQVIKNKMGNPSLAPHWSQAPDLVLWIMMIGALCAVGTRDRVWFVSALRQERNRLGMMNWANLRLRLMEFLWFPLTSDSDGLELWEEIQQSSYVMPWENPTVLEDVASYDAFRVRSRSGSGTTPASMMHDSG